MSLQFLACITLVISLALGGGQTPCVAFFVAGQSGQQGTLQTGDAAARERAEALLKAGIDLRENAKSKDDYVASRQKLEEVARLYQSLGDRAGEAEALLELAATMRMCDYARESPPNDTLRGHLEMNYGFDDGDAWTSLGSIALYWTTLSGLPQAS